MEWRVFAAGDCTSCRVSLSSNCSASAERNLRACKAMEYLTRAGQRALNRSAYAEAQVQFQQGLEWIKRLQESPERDARELELTSTLAQVLTVTGGWTSPEARAAAERSRDLAEKSGNLAQLVVQVFGIWRRAIGVGDFSAARHAGYAISQVKRKRVEEIFGWMKTIGGLRKTRHRGADRVAWVFTFTAAAYNLVRMRNLLPIAT